MFDIKNLSIKDLKLILGGLEDRIYNCSYDTPKTKEDIKALINKVQDIIFISEIEANKKKKEGNN